MFKIIKMNDKPVSDHIYMADIIIELHNAGHDDKARKFWSIWKKVLIDDGKD